MNKLQSDFEECVANYDSLITQRIFIENILNKEQLHLLDRLIFSYIDKQWRKVAFIVGKVLADLQTNKQLSFFAQYKDYTDILINQRIAYLENIYRIQVKGNVKAMRFSEVIIFSQDLLLLEQTLYLLRCDGEEDKTLSFNMADIIASGLKEQLKLQGEEINDSYIKKQSLALVQEQKEREDSHHYDHAIVQYIKKDVYSLKQQINYGNRALEHIYYYLNNMVENHKEHFSSIQSLCEAFPMENIISLPQTISIKNQEYHLTKVLQKHKTSCSIACLSIVTGIDYNIVLNKAKELFNWPKNRTRFGLTTDNIQILLSYYGINHQENRYHRLWKDCSDLAICVIDLDVTEKHSHAVVFFRKEGKEYVIDPGFENPIRVDFYNMTLESFINII